MVNNTFRSFKFFANVALFINFPNTSLLKKEGRKFLQIFEHIRRD